MKIKKHIAPIVIVLAILVIIASLIIYLTTNQKEEKSIAILTMTACVPTIACVLRGRPN